MTHPKLELVWSNKDKVLLHLDENGEPVWGTWDDVDTRLLIEQAHHGDPDAENLLIKGDNLLALQALLPQFAGRIKLIYIDPPFNTGSAFEHYDDGLEHSIWLSLMFARLRLLERLLANDGAIFVHIRLYRSLFSVSQKRVFGHWVRQIGSFYTLKTPKTGIKWIEIAPTGPAGLNSYKVY